jgi:hypothetical protein
MDFKTKLILKAIEDGWTVTKRNNTYTFTKLHRNLKEYVDPFYLQTFFKKYS